MAGNRKIITIHTGGLRKLTPQVVRILQAISDEFNEPEIRQTQEGLTVYVRDWQGFA